VTEAAGSPLPSWLVPGIACVVLYRAAMAALLEAFHQLPSLARRRLLEEAQFPNPLLAGLLARPRALGFGISLWNQVLLVLLLGLAWPLAAPLGFLSLPLVLLYLWLLDLVLPALLTARDPGRWINLLFPLYAPLHLVLGPLVAPLVRRVARLHEAPERGAEREETSDEAMTALLEEGEAEGILEVGDRELIRNVVEFGDTVVREVMTPRTQFQALSVDAPSPEVWAAFRTSRYSRLPVHEGAPDRIVGVLLLKDLVQFDPDEALDLRTLAKPALFVPESKPVLELLRELQRARTQLAVVVDEFGSVSGLVTLEDLLEEIFGEIREEHERAGETQTLPDGDLLVSGSLHVEDLEAHLGLAWDHEGFDTVAGLILSRLGRVPRAGEFVEVEGARLTVTAMEGARILEVRVAVHFAHAGRDAPPSRAPSHAQVPRKSEGGSGRVLRCARHSQG
jgi:putative hemolysin